MGRNSWVVPSDVQPLLAICAIRKLTRNPGFYEVDRQQIRNKAEKADAEGDPSLDMRMKIEVIAKDPSTDAKNNCRVVNEARFGVRISLLPVIPAVCGVG